MGASTSETLIRQSRVQAQATPYKTRTKTVEDPVIKKEDTGAGIQELKYEQPILPPKLPQATFTPWVSIIQKAQHKCIEAKLHDELVAYDFWVRQTEQEAVARRVIFECVETIVKGYITGAKVELFGSSATGLCLSTSDIDIVVTTRKAWSYGHLKKVLAHLSDLLTEVRLTKLATFDAKVPIVKFVTRPELGRFSVDISVDHTEGVQGKEIINDYLAKMPILRPLVLAIKGLVAKNNLNNTVNSGLGSYAITCMCIYFINANPSKRPQSYFDIPYASYSLGALLSDFLWHFSNQFPYTTAVISPRDGKLYPNLDLEGWLNTNVQKRITVQCLIHPENNVARAVSQRALGKLICAFQNAYFDIVHSTLHDRTILGKFIKFDKSTLGCRTNIRDMMDRDTLEKAVSNLKWKAGEKLTRERQCVSQNWPVPRIRNISAPQNRNGRSPLHPWFSYHAGRDQQFASNASLHQTYR
ncbi:hypothetical protein APHAL10511_005054 [Amanita phalloides]|nr:hypothetical protein APHAL10511_005054 [Amanita phalloides]